MSDAPVFIPLRCACKACGHRWDDWQPSYVPVATWVAHIKTIRCPQCGKGGRSVLLRSSLLPDGVQAPGGK